MKDYKCNNSLLNIKWRTYNNIEISGWDITTGHLRALYTWLKQCRDFLCITRVRNRHPDYWIKWCEEVARIRNINLDY